MNDEIPTVPPGPISMEQDGDNLFLLMHGTRIAKRGRPGTRKAKKWIPIVSWIDSVCAAQLVAIWFAIRGLKPLRKERRPKPTPF